MNFTFHTSDFISTILSNVIIIILIKMLQFFIWNRIKNELTKNFYKNLSKWESYYRQ